MNMVRLRQILASRRATKQPPLIPLRRSKHSSDDTRRHLREVLDIHLQINDFLPESSKSETIVCTFSEVDDVQPGAWKVIAAVEVPNRFSKVIDLPSAFAVEFQLERPQVIRLDICDLFAVKAVSLGWCYFTVSEVITLPLGEGISRKIINDETSLEIAEANISSTLRQRPHAVLIQFGAKNLVKKSLSTNFQVFFEVHKANKFTSDNDSLKASATNHNNGSPPVFDGIEDSGDSPSQFLLYRSEPLKYNSNRIVWRSFSLKSTEITEDDLQVQCYYKDGNSQHLLGQFLTTYTVLRQGVGPRNNYFLIYESNKGQKKSSGLFELLKIAQISTPSFLEFITSGMEINFAIAVDFSRPETPVEEALVKRYVEDIETTISSFVESLKDFAPNAYAGFGLGAKIPPSFRESQEFCLNLELDPYCNGLNEVLSAFKKSFANVQPINIAHLSHVIYRVSKLAQNTLNRVQTSTSGRADSLIPPYFLLVIITRGIFDDLKETVQAIIFASRLPISIIFVGIEDGVSDQGELERMATARTRLNYHGRRPERDCIHYVSMKECRGSAESRCSTGDLKVLISEQGLAHIPWQICNWMSRNGHRPRSIAISPTHPVAANSIMELIPNIERSKTPEPKKGKGSRRWFGGHFSPQPHHSFDNAFEGVNTAERIEDCLALTANKSSKTEKPTAEVENSPVDKFGERSGTISSFISAFSIETNSSSDLPRTSFVVSEIGNSSMNAVPPTRRTSSGDSLLAQQSEVQRPKGADRNVEALKLSEFRSNSAHFRIALTSENSEICRKSERNRHRQPRQLPPQPPNHET